MTFDYDLFVIGGGSGGVRAARVAASEGVRVGLAEESRMGGTCVIRGCVPKKLMVFASSYSDMMEDAQSYGWDLTGGPLDWVAFRTKLEAELDRLENVYESLLTGSGVTWFKAHAVLKDANTVELSDGQSFTAKTILVATGGHPFVPENVPESPDIITSNDIFHLESLPKDILIVGGGYIACEFACILNGLGVEVTQFYRGAQVLRGFDDEARGLVATEMQSKGIRLHTGTNPVEIEARDDGVWVKATDGSHRTYEKVLFATGRIPNTKSLGLEDIGVELGRAGEIKVDAYSQTAVPSIYAIGDVTNRVNLTPVAIREGMAFVETVFKDKPTAPDHDLIPSAVFTQPELGTIGLTEEDAAEQEPIEVYCTSFKPMQQNFAGREDRVLMKLIVSKASRKILGCHIVAPAAGEMIQMAGIAVKMGATKEDFDRTVAVHPTMSEELVTMKAPVRSA